MKEKKLIEDFWVSGHKVKAKTLNERISIVSHKNDLLELTEEDVTDIFSKCKL